MRIEEEPILYKINDFLVLLDRSAKDNFIPCFVTKNINKDQVKAKVVLLKRKQNHLRHFVPEKLTSIDLNNVLLKSDDFFVKKQKNGEEVIIYISRNSYEAVNEEVKEIMKERNIFDLAESENEEECEEDAEEIDVNELQQEFSVIDIKLKKPNKKKKSVPKKREKKLVLKFKRGKDNPFVKMVIKSDMFEKDLKVPDFSCCKKCNTKELFRAITNKNQELLDKILKSKKQIISINPKFGPHSFHNLLSYLIELKAIDLFLYLIDPRETKNIKFGKSEDGFTKVNTGFNDKYAYGVQTRTVELSRKNREGLNAFSYNENSCIHNFEFYFERLEDPEILSQIKIFDPTLYDLFYREFTTGLLKGNVGWTSFIAKNGFENGGYGFNEFHHLALSAKSIEELNNLKKINTTKKAVHNQGVTPLHCACLNPNKEILQFFLEKAENNYVVDDLGRKLCHFAAAAKTTSALELLSSMGIDLRDLDISKKTPLMYAAAAGRAKNIDFMCKKVQYNVNFKSKEGYAALHYACLNGHLEVVSALIEHGADVNIPASKRKNALMMAAEKGFYDLVVFLVEKGASLIRTCVFKKNALFYAVTNGHVKIASFLLKHGIPFDTQDSSNNTALHFACAYGYYEMIPLLISAGSKINVPNSWNYTPLLCALKNKHYRTIKVLVNQEGIDINCRDSTGQTFIMSTITNFDKQSYEFLKFLIEKKNANMKIVDLSGNGCFHILSFLNPKNFPIENIKDLKEYKDMKNKRLVLYEQYFDLILKQGVDLNQNNFENESPFILAIKNKNWSFLELCFKNGCLDLTKIDKDNKTVLHYCENLLFNKKGIDYLEKIVGSIENISNFEKVFDKKEGFNFLHYLFNSFILKTSYANINEYFGSKKNIFNMIIQNFKRNQVKDKNLSQSQVHDISLNETFINPNDTPEVQEINDKIEKLEIKNKKMDEIIKINFIRFLEFLRKRNFDFSVKVELVEIPYEETETKNENVQSFYLFQNQYTGMFVYENYNKIKKKTLKKPYDFLLNDDAGCSLLHLLMKNPDIEIFDEVLNYLVDTNKFYNDDLNYYNESLIYYFIEFRSRNSDILERLKDIGEDVNIPNENNDYPLINLCKKNQPDLLSILLGFDINLNVVNKKGESPLIILAKSNRISDVLKLIQKGLDINITDNKGRNALHWVINNNISADTNFELEEILIQNGINVEKEDYLKRRPIHYFFTKISKPFINSRIDPIELFSDYLLIGSDLDTKDKFGNTPFFYACQRGSYLCCTTLLKRNCNLDIYNNENNHPLLIALLNSHFDVCILILQKISNIPDTVYIYDHSSKKLWKKILEKRQSKLKIEEEKEHKQIKIRKKDFSNKQKDTTENYDYNTMNIKKSMPKRRAFGFPAKTSDSEIENEIQDEKKLEELAKKNFLVETQTIFNLALNKNADSINFLLLDSGFDIGIATMESLKKNLPFYTLKLLRKKSNIDPTKNNKNFQSINKDGQNLFHIFASVCKDLFDNNLKIFELLLLREISFNKIDNFGNVPLILTAYNNNYYLIEKLIEMGVDPNTKNFQSNNFLTAILQKNPILKKNSFVSLKIPDSKNFTNNPNTSFNFMGGGPNIFAGTFNFGIFGQPQQFIPSRLKILSSGKLAKLPRNNNFNFRKQPDDNDNNEVDFAEKKQENKKIVTENDILEWIEKISKYKIDLNISFEMEIEEKEEKEKKIHFMSLLGYSIIKLKNLKLAQLLIKLGCDINAQDAKGHTVITYALKNNNKILLEFLEEYENIIDFNIVDFEKKSYIHFCVSPLKLVSYQNTKLLRYLSKKVNLDVCDIHDKPAIYYAKQQENKKMYKELIKLGAKDFDDNDYDIKIKPVFIKSSEICKKVVFNYEEDYELYCVNMKNKDSKKKMENIQKLDSRFIGKVEKVFDEKGEPYMVNLTKVDVDYGYYSQNLFYRMQIGKDIIRNIYLLFTNWGRIGNDGQFQLTPFYTLEDCLKEFKSIFKEKTRNNYEDIEHFQKFTRKYRLVPFKKTYKNHKILRAFDLNDPYVQNSELPKELYNFMINLTDDKYYRVVYDNFQLDNECLPLGYLSKQNIQEAKIKLQEIKDLLEEVEKERKEGKLSSADIFNKYTEISIKTSDYYELIPNQITKTGKIPVLNYNSINNEMRKILDLENFEVATKIMCAANLQPHKINPIDYCFKCLEIDARTLDNKSEEFSIIKKYFMMGYKTESKVKIQTVNIFAIDRKGESERFKPWEKSMNRRLLWHGTRTENLMSILKEGLRIAPASANSTGAMFNSGVYFADISSKSMNYSSNYVNVIDKPVYIMLCEVALGKMKKLYQANNDYTLEKNYQSVKGCGSYTPNKFQRVYYLNGCMIPLGEITTKQVPPPLDSKLTRYNLNHNEYVVYNTSQVKIRYILEIKI